MIAALPERKLHFDNCYNFRDLGGYRAVDGRRVKWRRLFRSDALHFMSPEDVLFTHHDLGVRTIIDLRSPAEIQNDGLGPVVSGPVSWYRRPMVQVIRSAAEERANGNPGALADWYLVLLNEGAVQVARTIQLLSTDIYPALFHCAAGKDRTGIVAAMVLGLLGVDDETIIEDYMLSNLAVPRIVERMRLSPGYAEIVGDLPTRTFKVRRETMRTLLDGVRAAYGSLEGFVMAHGVERGEIRRLRTLLLD